jgi:hypothetical protein
MPLTKIKGAPPSAGEMIVEHPRDEKRRPNVRP